MSMLQYFKLINNESSSMLCKPERSLSMSVPSEAIATANKKVTDVLHKLDMVNNHRGGIV